MNNLCITCRQKNNNLTLNRLREILYCLNRVTSDYSEYSDVELEHCFLSEIKNSTRCKHGMGTCHYLSNNYNSAKSVARDICRKLPILIESGNEHYMHEVLVLCRGYFPKAYRMIEYKYM